MTDLHTEDCPSAYHLHNCRLYGETGFVAMFAVQREADQVLELLLVADLERRLAARGKRLAERDAAQRAWDDGNELLDREMHARDQAGL